MTLGLSFNLYTVGIFQGSTLLYTWLPLGPTSMIVSGQGLFFHQGLDECLCVEWKVCMGIYCFIFLTGGVGPGVCYILAIYVPWADVPANGGDCFVC